MSIPLGKPFFDLEEEAAVLRVLHSCHVATGETVEEFEAALAARFDRRYCVAVSSGSVALWLSLKLLRVKHVIVPAITCEAVLQAVLNAGASVTFADVDAEAQNIDLDSVPNEALSTADAVIVTHTYGQSAELDTIQDSAAKNGLILVEDFAQAVGGAYRGQSLGGFGLISVASFNAPKVLATAYGGAVFTDDADMYDRLLYSRRSYSRNVYEDIVPLNLQMTDLQAALGLAQLQKLDEMVALRNRAAARYTAAFKTTSLGLPSVKPYARHAWYKYAVTLPHGIDKISFIYGLAEQGIEAGQLYDPPLHRTVLALKYCPVARSLPVAERVAGRTVSLPMFAGITDGQIDTVVKAVSWAIATARRFPA